MRWIMHKKMAYFSVAGLSIILLGISLWGVYVDSYRDYKEKYHLLSASSLYIKLDESFSRHGPTEKFLSDFVNNIGAVVRYEWPDDIEYMPIQENWILYLLRFIDPLASRYLLNDPQTKLFGKVELPNYKHAFSRGFGLCSQLSLGTADLLYKRYGINARVAALNGHVVVQTSGVEGKDIIIDASYGFFVVGNVMHPDTIDRDFINRVQSLKKSYLTADDNYVAENAGWSAYSSSSTKRQLGFFYFVVFSYYLKWFLPFFGLGVSLFSLFSLNRPKVISPICVD